MFDFIIIATLISIINISTSVPVGGNLDQLRDWSRSLPYANLIRQTRQWSTPDDPYDGNATYDPITGWPTSDFSIIIATDDLDFNGTYLLTSKGNAQISRAAGSPGSIRNRIYNSTTNTLTASIVVRQGADQLMLSFQNTTGPGLQNLTILQPEYDLLAQANLTNLFLAHISRFNLIRFMQWTDTNANFEVNWNDTTPFNWPLYHPPKHNPCLTIPYIVNQFNTSIDIWINIPQLSSDDYIINLARLLIDQVKSTTNIYIEYSNEVWNSVFPQAKDNLNAANDSVHNHGDPYHFAYDNSTDVYTWAHRRIAYRIKHVSDLFKTIFGQDNVGPWKRIRPILCGEARNQYLMIDYLNYLNINFGSPSQYLHGIAIAPYFNLEDYKTWSNLTTDQVLDALNISIQQFLPEQGWHQHASIGVHAIYAAWFNLSVYAYEGGADTAAGCGDCSLEAKINATRHPRMTDVCVTFLDGWYRFGFQTFNWYVAGAGKISKFGSFTLLEDMRQETLIDTTHMFNASSPVAQLPRPSPKLKAIDIIRNRSIQLTFGIPIPSSSVNATNYMNHPVPLYYPDLRNLAANSTFYYPIQVFQSPIQINITVYVAGKSGVLEGGINNSQFVQVQTPKTVNTTTFVSASPMQFHINQTIVPSIVAFRLKNIEKGYSISSFDVVLS